VALVCHATWTGCVQAPHWVSKRKIHCLSDVNGTLLAPTPDTTHDPSAPTVVVVIDEGEDPCASSQRRRYLASLRDGEGTSAG
jgi:hypothetical protein